MLSFGVVTKRFKVTLMIRFCLILIWRDFARVLPGDKKSMRLLASVYDRVGNTEWLNNGPFEQK